jgi:hypothetical protein
MDVNKSLRIKRGEKGEEKGGKSRRKSGLWIVVVA